MDDNESKSLSEIVNHYTAVFMQRRWLILASILFAGVAALIISLVITPVYQASTLVLVNPAPASQAVDWGTLQTSQALAQTYVKLLTARPILEGVIEKLDLNMSPADLGKRIRAEVVRNTQLIQVKAEDPDPKRAAQIANAVITEFSDQNMQEQASRYAASRQRLESQLAQVEQQIQETNKELAELGNDPSRQSERDQLNAVLAQNRQSYDSLVQSYEELQLVEAQSISNIVQKEPAIPPIKPVRPKVLLTTVLATILGLILSLGVVILIESLDDSLKGPEDVTRQLGLPVLGIIAAHETENSKLITIAQPLSPVSEAFRSLRTNLQFASVDRPLRSVMVTSPTQGDGKSTVAGNLGVILAQGGRRVVVVDADLRRPMIHNVLGIRNRTGLTSLFTEATISLDGNLQETDVLNMQVITSGGIPPNPSELLGSEKMTRILEHIYDLADFVVVDSPPVLLVTDAAVLTPKVDGVLLVVKPGSSNLQACKQSIEQLKIVGAHILGVVINNVDIKRTRYGYGYKMGYYNSDHKGDASTSKGSRKRRKRSKIKDPGSTEAEV